MFPSYSLGKSRNKTRNGKRKKKDGNEAMTREELETEADIPGFIFVDKFLADVNNIVSSKKSYSLLACTRRLGACMILSLTTMYRWTFN